MDIDRGDMDIDRVDRGRHGYRQGRQGETWVDVGRQVETRDTCTCTWAPEGHSV